MWYTEGVSVKVTTLAFLFALVTPTARVSIRVGPHILQAGQGVTVICTVPRHPDNRRITATITGYTSSERQIDGDDAPVTFRFSFVHVPCDVDAAVCVLQDSLGGQATASSQLLITGCDP
jgi:hypothetical protein